MFERILIPVDGSPYSQAALRVAGRLACENSAHVTLCTVMDVTKPEYAMAFGTPETLSGLHDALRDGAKVILEEARALLSPALHVASFVREGNAISEILAQANEGHADLIVIGSHGRSGLSRAFMGSVAEGVLRRASIPVMIVRPPAAASTDADTGDTPVQMIQAAR